MSEPFLGEIRLFAFNFAPRGWAQCAGQMMPLSQNTALFSLLGTYYGGDGRTTFALPDLRGRVAIGLGAAPGLTHHQLGSVGGAESVALTQLEIPAHAHTVALGAAGDATTKNPAHALPAFTEAGPSYGTAAAGTMAPAHSQPTGGSQPHANMQPYLVLNYCIALQGIFPSQN